MMKAIFSLLILSIVTISCNPVGEIVTEETPLDPQLVNTVENLDLKKGDVLVIWGKMDASFLKNDNVPIFHLSYNLSLDDKTIENKTVGMFADNSRIINSTHEIRKEEKEENNADVFEDTSTNEESSTEKPEKIAESDWTFEQEVIQIPIEKDGKYTLDYKANSSDQAADSMFTKVSVIIRKK
ncbi:hypothetical protein ACFOWU_13205 [Epilithonimonas zeae]|nr:hypothetical protein [Epilithonimonas zeae]